MTKHDQHGDVELQPLLQHKINRLGEEPAQKPRSAYSLLVLAATALAWTIVSNSTILVNRYLMVDLPFAYPIAISCLGMLVTSFASFAIVRVFKLVNCKEEMSWPFYFRTFVPVTTLAASSLFTSNMAYLYLTVSFIQILKAATPILTMLALYFLGLESPCPRLVASVMIVCAGTMVSTYGELHINFVGLLLMVIAEVGEALRLALTQWLLNGLQFHPMEALMYMSPAVSAWLFAGMVVFELPGILQTQAWRVLMQHIPLCVAASILGFGVNILTLALINQSSALSVKILGVIRNISLVAIGIMLLSDIVTAIEVVGYGISLVGLLWYNMIKFSK